ncbi:MAG: glutamine synthetase family protein [Patescibacteria group bacterium]|nr:glutamine synthetase family protein [Patescibacteria group bacterium]
MPTTQEIKRIIKKQDVRYIQCWFSDVLGNLKSFSITPGELDVAIKEGMGFDGSSIEGFARIEESDLLAKPDLDTFALIPWSENGRKSARFICDILKPNEEPYEGDPRYVLRRAVDKAKSAGFIFYVGPELEYFYFKSSKKPEIIDRAGYFDGAPADLGEAVREKTIEALQSMGIYVEYSHHEVAPSQHEIDLRYDNGLAMADKVMTYRFVVKEIARQNELYATFMPKPVAGINGSGMHCHQSLFSGNKNAFYKKNDKRNLSDKAKQYVAGLLKYMPEITSVLNQWVNSYKRLVPGYEAPVYVAWGQKNRSALVRVPNYKPGKEKASRVELRSPDPAANPYLCFSVMLQAGLKGIEEKLKLIAPVEENIYEMNEKAREQAGIISLPGSLKEAVGLTAKSRLAKEVLGEHIFSKFVENKRIEWDKYRTHVSRFEVEEYLPVL